jgi:hypothetical protein
MHEKMRIQVSGDITYSSKFHRNYTTFINVDFKKIYYSQRNNFVMKKNTYFEIFGNTFFFGNENFKF